MPRANRSPRRHVGDPYADWAAAYREDVRRTHLYGDGRVRRLLIDADTSRRVRLAPARFLTLDGALFAPGAAE